MNLINTLPWRMQFAALRAAKNQSCLGARLGVVSDVVKSHEQKLRFEISLHNLT